MEQVRAEKIYLKKISSIEDGLYKASLASVMEGFEYFKCYEYKSKDGAIKDTPLNKIMGLKGKDKLRGLRIMGSHMGKMLGAMNESFNDIQPYIDELKESKRVSVENSLMDTYPNRVLWKRIKKEAWERWGLIIGFTRVPRELIFEGKGILFNNVIICAQEMEKEKIDQAPTLTASDEVLRVYKTLGIAVNEMAQWLRDEYNIKCQSNHPLGGLVDTSPLAVQAGLGFQGCNGLLITPEFGQRQRIAPIFVQQELFQFTDSKEHSWGEKFCEKCGRCRKACPTGAINEKKKVRLKGVHTLGEVRQCIDREKCFPYFSKTFGCSVCLKVCPFSKGGDFYMNMKKRYCTVK